MRLTYIANALSIVLGYLNLALIFPIVVALIFHDYKSILPFIVTGLIAWILSIILKYCVKGTSELENMNDIKKAEALFIVTVSWIMFAIIVAIPYLFYGLGPVDALFESVSGITTTGATILTSYEYPNAFFFWRSFAQWLGGLGIIVLFIAILPQFAVAGRQMFFAEAPGPTEDKLTPRIRNTASALWKIYLLLTVICMFLLILAGMNPFDAVCNSMSSLAAGGFSPNSLSTQGYNSNLITWIMLIFMFLAGTSFNLLYNVIKKRNLFLFFKSEEFKLYLSVILLMSTLITLALVFNNGYSLFDGITHSLYQVISIATSTGSASVDFVQWDLTAKILLFLVMFMGSCSSSAGGGIKMTRWLILFRTLKAELVRILHPNAVINVKIDNNNVAPDIIRQIIIFIIYYFIIFTIGAIIIAILEQNTTIGLAGSITALGNIGPGFETVTGPMGSFASLHWISKSIMILWMLVGRLEIIPFIVLLQPDFWSFKEK